MIKITATSPTKKISRKGIRFNTGRTHFKKGFTPWNKGLSKKIDKKLDYERPTKFKKGEHPSPLTQFKKGQRPSPQTEFKKGQVSWSKLNKDKMPRGEKHWEWKGDFVGYIALHSWIKRQLGKPKECELCNKQGNIQRFEWANLSRKYKRDLNDWIRLCKVCHENYDKGLRIISYSPCRISMWGGGTDLAPFSETYGGKVLNMAINLRHYCELVPIEKTKNCLLFAMNEKRKISLDDIPQLGIDPKFDLIYEVLRSYKIPCGFILREEFDGLQSAGLGSSASAAVGMIGAFNRWLGIKQTKNQIAEKAWRMEINLGWVSGKQDQYASVYGGVNFFEFDKQVWNEPISKGICDEFVDWCLLVYTGKTRHSAKLQEKLKERMKSSEETIKALKAIRTLTWEARDALKKADYEKVGIMLGQEWGLKKQSNPTATNERIDSFYDTALNSGALGGKVLGAGGEGHMLFIVNPTKRKQIIENLGLQEIDFSIDYNGLETRISNG